MVGPALVRMPRRRRISAGSLLTSASRSQVTCSEDEYSCEPRACVEGDKVVGLRTMARLRSEIRTLEAKQRDLDRLITALDRRFAPPWASEG